MLYVRDQFQLQASGLPGKSGGDQKFPLLLHPVVFCPILKSSLRNELFWEMKSLFTCLNFAYVTISQTKTASFEMVCGGGKLKKGSTLISPPFWNHCKVFFKGKNGNKKINTPLGS